MMLRIVILLACLLLAVETGSQPLSIITLQNAQSADANGVTQSLATYSVATLQVIISGAIVVNFEVSIDGTNYFSLYCQNGGSPTKSESARSSSLWMCPVGGVNYIRARTSGSTGSPSATVTLVLSGQ